MCENNIHDFLILAAILIITIFLIAIPCVMYIEGYWSKTPTNFIDLDDMHKYKCTYAELKRMRKEGLV